METKRQSMAGKVAMPKNAGPQGGLYDLDVALSKAVGGRIRITTALNYVVEGTLFTACPITNLIAVNSSPASPNPSSALAAQSGEYHVIPVSQIQNFQILSTPTEGDRVQGTEGFEGAVPSISRLDLDTLKAREIAAIRKVKEFDSTRGKDVTKEAQDIFDWIARTLPTRWGGSTIVVNDSVRIDSPYSVENCRAAKDNHQAEAQIKKVLEGYYTRKKTHQNSGNRPVVPATPFVHRKGG